MAVKRDKILKSAEKLVQKGKLDQAIHEYERLLKDTPDDTNTINRLGDLYGRVGEIDKAVALYERVAERFADQGFVPKAIAIYKKINRLAPQRLDIFERLGELYVEQGLMVEAKSQFRMLAEHYGRSEDPGGAIRAYQQLIDIDPDDSSSRLRLADALLESGDADEAMKAYAGLGETLLARGQLDEAERLFRRLLDHEFPDGDIMVPVCARLLEANRVTSAQELITAGLAVSAASIPLRTLQVRAFMALGETDDAVDLARQVLEDDPENPDVRGLVGNVLISDGDQEQAAEMMIPAAEALLEKADYSRAQRMLRELVDIAPDDERILRLAIRAFRPSGDQEMVTRLTASLADVCFSTGQEDQAKRFYLELVAGDPTNELYRERLAQLDGAIDQAQDAAQTSGFGGEVPPEITFSIDGDELDVDDEQAGPKVDDDAPFDPAERINEAAVFAKYGLNDKAIRHLEDVLRRVPDNLDARRQLAKALVAVGQSERALGVIEPVIAKARVDGDVAEAERLESVYGAGTVPSEEREADDDEVIIVEIDEEIVEIDEDQVADLPEPELETNVLDLGDVNVEDMVAQAIRDLDRPAPGSPAKRPDPTMDALLEDVLKGGAEARPRPPRVEAPSVDELGEEAVEAADVAASAAEAELVEDELVEDELVEEELVEISTDEDGPSTGELAQLDLFIDQGLYEDAVGILDRLETDHPGDPRLESRRSTLDELGVRAAPEPAAAAPRRPVEPVEPVQTPDDIFADEQPEEYIDLAKELEAELAEEEAMVEEATGRGKGEAILDEVFKEFQKGVAEQLSDEDSDTHFNLGIAYKEMGLLAEAIGEFQIASHDPSYFVEACSMIGVCANELGKHDEAAEWYQKALVAPDLSADARTALRYELALALERTGQVAQAVDLYDEIHSHDPAYRDVGARLSELTDQQRHVN